MKSILRALISVLADGASVLVRLLRPLGKLLVRFGRLACLRSGVCGTVAVSTQFDGPVHTSGETNLCVGEHCRLGRDVYFETQEQGQIRIGSHVRINSGTVIVSYSQITIGDDCLIGEYVSIRDANHGMQPGCVMRCQRHTSKPIAIGNDVWIGRGVMILGGVTIGSGAIIGANSVVTHNIPERAIAGGVPARIIRRREENSASNIKISSG